MGKQNHTLPSFLFLFFSPGIQNVGPTWIRTKVWRIKTSRDDHYTIEPFFKTIFPNYNSQSVHFFILFLFLFYQWYIFFVHRNTRSVSIDGKTFKYTI